MRHTFYQLSRTTADLQTTEDLGSIILVGNPPFRSIHQELRRTGILAANANFTIGHYEKLGFLILGENGTMFTLKNDGNPDAFIPDNAFADTPIITKMRSRPLRSFMLRIFNFLFPTSYPEPVRAEKP